MVRAEDALAAAGGGSDFETQASESAVPTDYSGSDYGSASPRSSHAAEGKFTLKLPGVMEGEEQYERPLVEFDDDGDNEACPALLFPWREKALGVRVLRAKPPSVGPADLRCLDHRPLRQGSTGSTPHTTHRAVVQRAAGLVSLPRAARRSCAGSSARGPRCWTSCGCWS